MNERSDPIVPPPLTSFDSESCELVEDLCPAVVSFHFGLPAADLVDRVRRAGAVILSSATTPAEAIWLEAHGCNVVIAQGSEAGGHRGMFLENDPARQFGTMALVPLVVDAVEIPVVAAGGIADARGVAAPGDLPDPSSLVSWKNSDPSRRTSLRSRYRHRRCFRFGPLQSDEGSPTSRRCGVDKQLLSVVLSQPATSRDHSRPARSTSFMAQHRDRHGIGRERRLGEDRHHPVGFT